MHRAIDFKTLIIHAQSVEGARALFERLITSLVRVKYKDAHSIRPNPGDWGIDVIEGKLTEACFIWQVKYFIDGIGDSQKAQIRDSFNQIMSKSRDKNFSVNAWTLCVPCSLAPQEMQWWEKWSKQMLKKYSVKIELWDEAVLRSELETPDAEHLRVGYFGQNPTTLYYFMQVMKEQEAAIQELPDPDLFEEALFIKKLKESGIIEYFSAKTQFFNAELLTQEILDKGVTEELRDLISLREKLRAMWEPKYNFACSKSDIELTRLYSNLMLAIQEQDKTSLSTQVIKASFVHKQGVVHQLADKCQVGWTRNFRKYFVGYYNER
jgi:hypothetical protein